MYLAVSVRHTGKHRDIFVIMQKVLFPYFNGFMVLIDRFVTIGQAEQGVIIPRIVFQAALIVNSRIAAQTSLANRVAHANKRVIIIFINLKDTGKTVYCFSDSVFSEQPVTIL
jgi:hypothetical protein